MNILNINNKDWLYKQYYNNKLSLQEIADICGVSLSTVHRRFIKFNMKRRTYKEAHNNEKHSRYKGGRINSHSMKYWRILKPDHPRAHQNGYVYEHILIAEEILGRLLTDGEIVHHINFNKEDNRRKNLYVFSNDKEHQSIKSSLFKLIEPLIENNIIYFDRSSKEYRLSGA